MDVVVNALSGDAMTASLDALAPGGVFVELGKRGIWDAAAVAARRPDVRYEVVDLLALTQAEPARVGQWLRELVAGVAAGTVQPLPVRTFALSDAAQAFRTLAAGHHIGKLVVVPPQPPSTPLVGADASYLLTGGRGALGLAAAAWLVAQGARHLALLSRGAPDAGQASRHRAAAGGRGAGARAAGRCGGRRPTGAAALQQLQAQLPPLRGVLHAAGVVGDGLLAHQDAG